MKIQTSVYYTQDEVLQIQRKIVQVLNRVKNEFDVLLDSEPIWFAGSMRLPKREQTWTLKVSSHGEPQSVEFSAAEIQGFVVGDPVASHSLQIKLENAIKLLLRPR